MSRDSQKPVWNKLHVSKLSIFAALSVADLFMTWTLVHGSDGRVYESNPFAGAWLASYGWVGLTVYKGLAMLLVGFSAVYVSLHRPRTGGRILTFACAATAAVVLYSCYLSYAGSPPDPIQPHELFQAEQKSQILDREKDRQTAYRQFLSRLADDLAGGRCTLGEAADELARSAKGRDGQWLDILRRHYPGRTDPECLAIHIGFHTLSNVAVNTDERDRLAAQFEADYRSRFGREVDFDRVCRNGGQESAWVEPSAVAPDFGAGIVEVRSITYDGAAASRGDGALPFSDEKR